MMRRVLVAGVGNIFLGDDAFGVEVAARLARRALPEGVEVADFGIRGVHLAYRLLDGYDGLILIDTVSRGGEPGTVYVVEPDGATGRAGTDAEAQVMDAHGMDPASVLSLLASLGGSVGRTLVVGCEPAVVEEAMGLSEPVERAVAPAVDVTVEQIHALLDRATAGRRTEEG